MATTDLMTPTIGVLDVDGLHLADRPLVPIRGAIRHVGDLYNGARRHGLTQLWLTDAWVRAAGLPDELARQRRPGRAARLPHGAHALARPAQEGRGGIGCVDRVPALRRARRVGP